jgi:sirohydrochlorin cobaltochelatase
MDKIGVMVCGHGSRDAGAVTEFEAVARGIRARLPQYDVESGFLEFATPIIRTGLDKLRDKGVTRCLAVPGMLFAAGHAKNDIPSVLNTYQAHHPEMIIDYGRELGIDPKLISPTEPLVRRDKKIWPKAVFPPSNPAATTSFSATHAGCWSALPPRCGSDSPSTV